MKVIIRDDDLCYYSDFDEFENIYNCLDVPVSISVVPFGVSDHGFRHPYNVNRGEAKPISDNLNLCNKLKEGLRSKKYEIMLHGFTHAYLEKNGKYIPEMMWRTKQECADLFIFSLKYLKEVFDYRPSFFVSPSDKCNKFLFKLLKQNRLNYFGLIDKLSSRPFSLKTLLNYIRRQFARVRYGYPYCGIMNYDGWKEIQTFQNLDFNYLVSIFNLYKKRGIPMVVETHYWQLRDNKKEYDNLKMFIKYAKERGAEFCLISDIL